MILANLPEICSVRTGQKLNLFHRMSAAVWISKDEMIIFIPVLE